VGGRYDWVNTFGKLHHPRLDASSVEWRPSGINFRWLTTPASTGGVAHPGNDCLASTFARTW
jgi:hypothetical protein